MCLPTYADHFSEIWTRRNLIERKKRWLPNLGAKDISPLSGVKRKSDLGAVRAAFDPERTLATRALYDARRSLFDSFRGAIEPLLKAVCLKDFALPYSAGLQNCTSGEKHGKGSPTQSIVGFRIHAGTPEME